MEELITHAGRIKIALPAEISTFISINSTVGQSGSIQFNQLVSSVQPFFSQSPLSLPPPSQTFVRRSITMEKYTDMGLCMFKGLCDQVGSQVTESDKDFEESVEEAAISILEQFGEPDVCIVVNSNTFILGDFTDSAIRFHTTTHKEGAIIVYSSYKFKIVKMSKEIPAKYHNYMKKYDKFLTRPFVIDLLRKLELN